MIFSEKDIQQITGKGMTIARVLQQLEIFKKGTPYIDIVAPATPGHGILKLSGAEKEKYALRFRKEKDELNILKFVPASGAASRMFTSLFEFLDEFDPQHETLNAYISRKSALDSDISSFFTGLEQLPFYDEVRVHLLRKYPEYKNMSADYRRYLFVKEMLAKEGLNYDEYPKALLPFHRYKTHTATAFEEHLFEAVSYGASNAAARLHFTVAAHYVHHFEEALKQIRSRMEKQKGIRFTVTFSHQKQHTDTIAVNLDNTPLRGKDNELVFRPSGHGALLENLNEQDADLVFIKNIDNVVVAEYEKEMAFYKALLAGKLLELRERVFNYAELLDASTPSEAIVTEIQEFLAAALYVVFPPDFNNYAEKEQLRVIKEKLNRPVRVCGMVKDEGEPGGGPFWVKASNGHIALQIVEAAQINRNPSAQKRSSLHTATHFNPVDMVCGIRNYRGEKYNLSAFADHTQCFITQKTEAGKSIKAIEAPGLWNGAMAYWNTVFVEVPRMTFNPVKTVNDLLKPMHQVK